MKVYILKIIQFILFVCSSMVVVAQESKTIIGVKGNGYYTNTHISKEVSDENESVEYIWNDTSAYLKVYFFPQELGTIQAWVSLKSIVGGASLKVSLDNDPTTYTLSLSVNNINQEIPIGNFDIKKVGYHFLKIKAISYSGKNAPMIDNIILASKNNIEIKYNKSIYKAAPSVHLRYQVPGDSIVKWFYTEVTVPKEVDKSVNAYYETNGFHSGYGGIQINSLKERRFIFSIWSKFVTDDPSKIPSDYAVNLKRKGKNVFTGEFGNEGSGGHSHLIKRWETGKSYHFLTGIKSIVGDSATYVGFYASPDDNYKWHLLSEWTQNKTDTKLGFKNLYAFVENFGDNGDDYFKAYYGNQWIITPSGNWVELSQAKFTTTAKPDKHQRYDYGAGVENNQFYMFTGGFKHLNNINTGDIITRPSNKIHPTINFQKLIEQ